jgi:spermidine synthase
LCILADYSGLGVGITAKSFHNSNLNVSVVEIDPVVHQFAEQYFGLPKLRGIVAYEDGRRFIERYAKTGEKWDYIIHDVFTGGSVPAHLFTEEMWSATKAVLAKNGVLAVVLSSFMLS